MFVNLISCDDCGIVYDKKKLNFAWRTKEDDSINEDYVRYSQRDKEYQPFVLCRVCNAEIFKSTP